MQILQTLRSRSISQNRSNFLTDERTKLLRVMLIKPKNESKVGRCIKILLFSIIDTMGAETMDMAFFYEEKLFFSVNGKMFCVVESIFVHRRAGNTQI
jgi:hypothetical protein